jgi:hypothetical protein
VTATTHGLEKIVRLLLSYGPNCKVIGRPEARQEMVRLVRGLAGLYGVGAAETVEDERTPHQNGEEGVRE